MKKLKANRDITAAEVRLVGTDGSHQVMTLAEALRAAQEAKLDLVEVAGDSLSCKQLSVDGFVCMLLPLQDVWHILLSSVQQSHCMIMSRELYSVLCCWLQRMLVQQA